MCCCAVHIVVHPAESVSTPGVGVPSACPPRQTDNPAAGPPGPTAGIAAGTPVPTAMDTDTPDESYKAACEYLHLGNDAVNKMIFSALRNMKGPQLVNFIGENHVASGILAHIASHLPPFAECAKGDNIYRTQQDPTNFAPHPVIFATPGHRERHCQIRIGPFNQIPNNLVILNKGIEVSPPRNVDLTYWTYSPTGVIYTTIDGHQYEATCGTHLWQPTAHLHANQWHRVGNEHLIPQPLRYLGTGPIYAKVWGKQNNSPIANYRNGYKHCQDTGMTGGKLHINVSKTAEAKAITTALRPWINPDPEDKPSEDLSIQPPTHQGNTKPPRPKSSGKSTNTHTHTHTHTQTHTHTYT